METQVIYNLLAQVAQLSGHIFDSCMVLCVWKALLLDKIIILQNVRRWLQNRILTVLATLEWIN